MSVKLESYNGDNDPKRSFKKISHYDEHYENERRAMLPNIHDHHNLGGHGMVYKIVLSIYSLLRRSLLTLSLEICYEQGQNKCFNF